jgi:hypothetical protein
VALERRKKNRIRRLKKDDGSVVENQEEMKEVVTNYFLNLFTSSTGSRVEELLGHIDSRITPDE